MARGESLPSQPVRVSALEKLDRMPSAQVLLRPQSDDTATYRYRHSDDRLTPPVVDEDLPFTATDSGEIRQAAFPAEQVSERVSTQWMSAEALAEMQRQAEAEALAELEGGAYPVHPESESELHFDYKGAQGRMSIHVEGEMAGSFADRLHTAFIGATGQPAFDPRHERIAGSRYEDFPTQDASRQLTAASYPYTTGEVAVVPAVESELVSLEAESNVVRSVGRTETFLRKRRKGIIGLVAIATSPLWYPSLKDVTYEAGRQGVNGELISISEAYSAFMGHEKDAEKE